MTDESEMLNLLRQLNTKFDGLDARFNSLDARFNSLDAKVDRLAEESALHTRAIGMLQQDVSLMRGVLTGHNDTIHILLQDIRMVRAAINDMVKDSVMPGEVAVLHEDVTRLQMEVSELKGRLTIVENRERV